MPIQVFADHVYLSEGTRLLVIRKAEHLRRIFDGISTVHVTLGAEKERRLAEIIANVSHGPSVVARASAEALREAIDEAFDKIETQLRKHKEKVRDHRVREHAEAGPPAPIEESDEEAPDTADTGPDSE